MEPFSPLERGPAPLRLCSWPEDLGGNCILSVEGTEVLVNKPYLSMQSPVFHRMFYGDLSTPDKNRYEVDDVDKDAFIELLQVILPSRKAIDKTNVESLLVIADRFEMDNLGKECMAFKKLNYDWKDRLEQKERMFQKACEKVKLAELRAERAEDLLDKKEPIVKGAKKKMDELVEGAKQKEEELKKRMGVISRKFDASKMNEGHLKAKTELLYSDLRTSTGEITDLERENASLKTSLTEANAQLAILQAQFTESQQQQQALPTHPPLPLLNREDLQEQLNKMERMYQKACREARLAELRAEQAESRLETKQGILDGSAQQAEYERLINESQQAKKEAKDSKKKCEALEQEIAALKEEIIRDKEKFELENASLKASLSEANAQLAILQAQFAELQQQQAVNRVGARSDEEEDNWMITCICGQKEDDGEACIGCDQCLVRWEHVDCIFPRTKQVPSGLYFCHVCKPRPTELTPEQARAYQDKVKEQKEEKRKNRGLVQKETERLEKKKEQEIFEDHDSFQSLNEQSMDFENETDRTEIQQENGQEPSIDDLIGQEGGTEEALKDDEAENRRRSSRITSKPLKAMGSMEDSEDDTVPPVKKSRSDSVKKVKSPGNKNEGKNKTHLECPKCKYRTKSAPGWVKHLQNTHHTTPTKCGLALLCECGAECVSKHHSYTCKIANFTVIKMGTSLKLTPQCLLCDAYPKTALGYAAHLSNHHKSSLRDNGIYLTCSCGHEVHSSYNSDPNHTKKCDGRQFTLHKDIDEE